MHILNAHCTFRAEPQYGWDLKKMLKILMSIFALMDYDLMLQPSSSVIFIKQMCVKLYKEMLKGQSHEIKVCFFWS